MDITLSIGLKIGSMDTCMTNIKNLGFRYRCNKLNHMVNTINMMNFHNIQQLDKSCCKYYCIRNFQVSITCNKLNSSKNSKCYYINNNLNSNNSSQYRIRKHKYFLPNQDQLYSLYSYLLTLSMSNKMNYMLKI